MWVEYDLPEVRHERAVLDAERVDVVIRDEALPIDTQAVEVERARASARLQIGARVRSRQPTASDVGEASDVPTVAHHVGLGRAVIDEGQRRRHVAATGGYLQLEAVLCGTRSRHAALARNRTG